MPSTPWRPLEDFGYNPFMRKLLLMPPLLFALSLSAKPSGYHKKSSRAKTVHVNSYTKKNGKTVHGYDRAAPSH